MKFNPLISVIIPIYNKEPYLKECLDSVLKQSYKNIEVICIDDGSTDNSISIVEDIIKNDNRVSLYKSKHAGPSSARNIGIEHAKGDYIHFMDADDFLKANCYEFIFNKLLFVKKDIMMLSFYHCVFNNAHGCNNDLNKNSFFLDYCGDADYKLLNLKDDSYFLLRYNGGGPCVSNKLLKREVIEKNRIRFDANCFCEDNMFFFEYAKYINNCLCFPFDFYCYRQNFANQHSYQKQNVVPLQQLVFLIFDKFNNDYKKLGDNVYLSFCNSFLECAFAEYKNISIKEKRFIGINDLKKFFNKFKNDLVFSNALKKCSLDYNLLAFNESSICSNVNYKQCFEEEKRKYEEEKRKYEEEKRKYEEEKRKYEEEKRSKEILYNSITFKVGKVIVYPFRLIKRAFKKIFKRK